MIESVKEAMNSPRSKEDVFEGMEEGYRRGYHQGYAQALFDAAMLGPRVEQTKWFDKLTNFYHKQLRDWRASRIGWEMTPPPYYDHMMKGSTNDQ